MKGKVKNWRKKPLTNCFKIELLLKEIPNRRKIRAVSAQLKQLRNERLKKKFRLSFRNCMCLRADVCKYQPEVCNSEKFKILKKIHNIAHGKLLQEIHVLLRSDNYF